MKETGMVRIRTPILRRYNTVAKIIATRPILDLCKKATQRPGARVTRQWWEQTGVDWKGARERAAAAAAELGMEGFTDLESEDAMGGAVGGTGEEASLGASGSSGAEWSGAEWSGVERSGAEWSGVERSGAEWSGVERFTLLTRDRKSVGSRG